MQQYMSERTRVRWTFFQSLMVSIFLNLIPIASLWFQSLPWRNDICHNRARSLHVAWESCCSEKVRVKTFVLKWQYDKTWYYVTGHICGKLVKNNQNISSWPILASLCRAPESIRQYVRVTKSACVLATERRNYGWERRKWARRLCNFARTRRNLRRMQHHPAKTISAKVDVRKRRRTTNSCLPAK